ncbi:ATP-binding protein [Methylobacterium sp. J-068]|uniref:hybrid sensor histidine kinase/response regulator n=1 Tax=Methylobacterium sp. J-068 TaxID=2836649 RepID=UPI001FBAA07C|nr:ATP-binding protein [Methylobacterium sp. J-068]MCJ2035788.1 ATP-binding protein [Methylobacterium sp. J-068]
MSDPRPASSLVPGSSVRDSAPHSGSRPPRLRVARSLAARLALAVFGSVVLALALATAFSLWQEVHRYAETKRESLSTIAEIFAAASARAVDAGDAAMAARTLNAIGRRSDLVYAGIERPDGSILADRGLAVRLVSDVDLGEGGSPFGLLLSRTAQVQVPILEAGRRVGTLVLVADTTDLPGRVLSLLKASALGWLLALGFGLFLSYGLQRAITHPIAALAETMDGVRASQDYARTARIVRDDEVGVLARSFNALLGALRERDARLARHMEHLENEVAARTVDLHEAKEAAEAANHAKSSFLATMSHEIRTPLNGMLVMAELLADADLPERQKRHAEVIARSGQSLLAIINDILDFAKVEAGKLELEHVALDPAEIVDTVVSLFAEKARESGLDLAATVAPDVPARLLGDPVRLGQILGNFVNNALKFTPAGSVRVRLERGAAGGLRLSVRDTGIGIAADKVGGLFSAFSQADQSTTRRFGGTGLGLSIAQRLALAMGGRIGVDSRLGEGSTFWTELPLEAADASPRAAPRRAPGVTSRIVVAVAGEATGDSLREGLAAAGFAPAGPGAPAEADAHWIADAAAIRTLGRRRGGLGRVLALARFGDPAGTAILEAGWADALLTWPLVQAEWGPALAALASGTDFARRDARPAEARTILPQFPTARVLVADDSAVNREVARAALARCGITAIVMVEDGQAAVDACRAGAFDLVLMDGSMPILDGYAAAAAIRAEEASRGAERLPIVALTAHVVGAAAEAWRAAGMDGTLTKPFSLSGLGDMLLRFLDAPQGATGEAGTGQERASAGSAGPSDDADLLDTEVVDGLADMAERAGAGFAARILALYTENAPAALEALRDAAGAADVARAAHGLRSMSLNIGGRALARALAEIEEAARTEARLPSPDAIAALAPLIRRTTERVGARLGLETEAAAPGETRLSA